MLFSSFSVTCEVFIELDLLLWTLSTVSDSSLSIISFTSIFFQIEEEFVAFNSTRELSLYSQSLSEENIIDLHWSSVKEFSCLKAIDFALEASLKF